MRAHTKALRDRGGTSPYPVKPSTTPSPINLPAVCIHLGESTGESFPCTSCGGKLQSVPVMACAVHGKCTTDRLFAGTKCCRECDDRKVKVLTAPFEYVPTTRLVSDAIRLAALLPLDCAGIVGVPRSGMLPASVIATHLHLPLLELAENGPRELIAGSRGPTLMRRAGKLVVIDDTVYGGNSMKRARNLMGMTQAVYAAVYVRPESAHSVDLFARNLPSPHILEWNLANAGPTRGHAANAVYGTGLAFDVDGILIHDADSGGKIGAPYLVPRAHPVRLIVTGRQEYHREETANMLRSLGVQWDRLEMLPDDAPFTWEEAAKHKAKHYAGSGCGFFVESDPMQAEIIQRLSGKPVICPRVEKVFQ